MDKPGSDTAFAGSIPELYDTHFVPLIFEPYAADLARRIAALAPARWRRRYPRAPSSSRPT